MTAALAGLRTGTWTRSGRCALSRYGSSLPSSGCLAVVLCLRVVLWANFLARASAATYSRPCVAGCDVLCSSRERQSNNPCRPRFALQGAALFSTAMFCCSWSIGFATAKLDGRGEISNELILLPAIIGSFLLAVTGACMVPAIARWVGHTAVDAPN